MPQPDFIVGLDIGSSCIRVAVGSVVASKGRGVPGIQIIGVSEVAAEGMSRGLIASLEDAISTVSAALERAERMIGAEIKRAWVGISGSHVLCQSSRGVVGVTRPDGEIRVEDVERALDAARTVAMPSNYEILHVIPKTYTVDNQVGIKDPVGMTGIRLEVEAEIIQGLAAQNKNVAKCVYRTGIDIEDMVLGVLASAEATTTPRQKDLGVAVCNIGGATTSLVIFEGGDPIHVASLAIGSDHITSDLAIGLRTTIEAAETIKVRYGSALPKEVSRKDVISLREVGAPEDEVISQKEVAEIIEARVEEIFDKVEAELRRAGRSGLLPAGVVLSGGGAKLAGMTEVAKRKLKLPATLGYPLGVTAITDRVNDLGFTTAIGLVLWGASMHERTAPRASLLSVVSRVTNVGALTKGVRRFLGSLMP